MNARELRIGNNIYQNEIVIEVGHVDINKIDYANRCGVPVYGYAPIPLTEDWLDSFGCKKSGIYTFIGDQDRYNLSFGRRGYMLQYVDIPIKYVHQLQNVMFALTGIELIAREQNK